MLSLLAVLVAAGLLLCCSGRPERVGDKRNMNGAQMAQQDNCKLVVQCEIKEAKTLVLRYTFQNGTPSNIYVFNRLYGHIEDGPVFSTDVNLLNVEVSERGILLSKKIVPVPPDTEVEKPSIPCASLIRPGKEFTETLTLSLPVRPWTPYHESGGEGALQEPVLLKVWFEVGYFVSNPKSDTLAQPVQTKQGQAFYFDPFPVHGQKTLEVGPLPLSVPISRPSVD